MKKIILIVVSILCILQLIALAAVITIGSAATDRNEAGMDGFTTIDLNNAADGTGTIDTIKIWCNTNLTTCQVATFYLVSGNNYTTRDTVDIGAVTAGAERTFTEDSGSNPISLTVVAGDVLGIYVSGGDMERGDGGSTTYNFADKIPCTDTTFTPYAKTLSFGGTGTTEEEEEDNAIFFGFNF